MKKNGSVAKIDSLFNRKPRSKTLRIWVDEEKRKNFEELQKELDVAISGKDKKRETQLKKKIDNLYDDFESSTVSLTVRAVSRKVQDAIQRAHPPTLEQIEEAERNGADVPAFDNEQFNNELIIAALGDELTLEQKRELVNGDYITPGEFLALLQAALELSFDSAVLDEKKGYAPTRN